MKSIALNSKLNTKKENLSTILSKKLYLFSIKFLKLENF